jgi:site-specific recombinase XerD
MTKILHRDPERRCKPIEEWPARDRALWEAALEPGDLLEDGGSRARYAEYSNRNAVYGYGRWLTWLERQGLLEAGSSPADRIIPARVAAYIADLEKHNATQTLLNRLQELAAVAVVMDPHRDWSWIYRMYSQIRSRHRPARPKRHRLAPIQELFDLGLALMTEAEQEHTAGARALTYRDGLIVALLAARPLRLGNLAGLALDRTLVSRGTQWWIEFPASDTKTKEAIELPWPEPLITSLETYLARHRRVLAQLRGGSILLCNGALWISRRGLPMNRRTIHDRITTRTLEGLGRAINPHLFRDCAATSIAIDDPAHVRIASRLLGHRTISTTERYYNQARSVEASRLMQKVLLARRRGADALDPPVDRPGPTTPNYRPLRGSR